MNERELEELLRSRPDPLQPPSGRWESVRRRARRRRIAKLSAAVLATVVVAAGIGLGPTVLFDRDQHSTQRVSIAAPPTTTSQRGGVSPAPVRPSASPKPTAGALASSVATPSPLNGFRPSSVSFISQNEGFLLGATAGRQAVLAQTVDGGSSWSRLADIPIAAKHVGVRFATSEVGYVFGPKYFVTEDGGRSWLPQPSPGFINDLETMNGHVYALVSACPRCRQVSLYGATTTSPALARVKGVPTMAGDSVSLAVHDDAAYVLATIKGGTGQVWSTLNGTQWTPRISPCGSTMGLITEWSATGVAAACDVHLYGVGKESKRVYVSTNGATSWTALATPPTRFGYINSVSASGPDNVVVGDDQSGLDVTTDGGKHWSLEGPAMSDGARFVGFIGQYRVVALPEAGTDRFFTTSYDAGVQWITSRFPQ